MLCRNCDRRGRQIATGHGICAACGNASLQNPYECKQFCCSALGIIQHDPAAQDDLVGGHRPSSAPPRRAPLPPPADCRQAHDEQLPVTASIAQPSRSAAAPGLSAGRGAAATAACLVVLAGSLLAMDGDRAPWTVVLLVVLAPWLEEVVLRAGLQEQLLRRGMHPLATNLLCAAAFALMHGMTRSWLLAAWVILPALLLGAVYARKRRLGPVVALHSAMNFVWLSAGPAWTGLFIPTSL
jgi:hypothetical protein